jgi:hypothetical protein
VLERFSQEVAEPRREVIRRVLRRGIASGELRPDADVEIAMLAMTGAVMARGQHGLEQVPPGYAERIVDEVLRGLAAR